MPIREGDICYDCEIKEKQRREQHKRLFGVAFSKDVIAKKNLVDAIPIPQGATNGDMIKALFPNSEVFEPIVEDDIIHVVFADKTDSAIGFDYSWWNAPYKENRNVI